MTKAGGFVLAASQASPGIIGDSPDISLKTPTEANLVGASDFESGI